MSGFRTPQYNVAGGNTGGRAGLSRHMYGDAADVFIDNDGDGVMDDLNRDGRSSIEDARVIQPGGRPRGGGASRPRRAAQASIRQRPGTDLSFTSTRGAIAPAGSDPEEDHELNIGGQRISCGTDEGRAAPTRTGSGTSLTRREAATRR